MKKQIYLPNILKMNDWPINKFLRVIFAIQIAFLGLIGLDLINIHIPILREVIASICLLFVPGILILRILKLHDLGNTETFLYSVGLSIASLMFTGFFMNMIYPLFKIFRPLSLEYLIITINIELVLLSFFAYKQDKNFSNLNFVDMGNILSYKTIILLLIPFLAIIGTYLVNMYQNNILLMLMLVIISIIAILVGFDKFITKEYYPLVLFVITLSLLFHTSLISTNIWGWDIHQEFYFANQVIQNSFWNSSFANNVNAMLSIVSLAPIISIVSNINLTWILKIIYPFLFSLTSLGLYKIFQKQTTDKIAFLSTFFFVTFYVFFIEMVSLARQEIAELFLITFVLVLISQNISEIKKAILLITFSISIAVSHYGLSYIFIIFLISIWLYPLIENYTNNIRTKILNLKSNTIKHASENEIYENKGNRNIKSTFLLLYIIFTISWYLYVAQSSPFITIIHIGNQISSNIFTDFLNPDTAQGLNILVKETTTPLRSIAKYLIISSQLLIILGFIKLVISKKYNFKKEFIILLVINLALLVAGIAVPYFASSLNTTRLYQIALIFLSPLCVIGGIWVFEIINKVARRNWQDTTNIALKVLSIFFVVMFLFNSGFIYEVTNDHPISISLSQQSVKNNNNIQDEGVFYTTLDLFKEDTFSTSWFNRNVPHGKGTIVYRDYIANSAVTAYAGTYQDHNKFLLKNTSEIEPGAFVFVAYPNLVKNVGREKSGYSFIFMNDNISYLLKNSNEIYANGGDEIYRR